MQRKYEPMINLKLMRIKKGLTQEKLSLKIGKSKTLIYLYEKGYMSPTKHMLEKIAAELECSVADIL